MIGDTYEVECEPILGAPCRPQLVLLPEQTLQCAMAQQDSEITPGVENRTGTYVLFKLWCGVPPRLFLKWSIIALQCWLASAVQQSEPATCVRIPLPLEPPIPPL